MHSFKVMLLFIAVFVTIAMANNKKYAKCPKNSPHKAPCMLKNNAGTGECRSNGACTNDKCTKWCKEIVPTTTIGLSSTPTPAEPTTTPEPLCSASDIAVTSGSLVFNSDPELAVGATDSISCASGYLLVIFSCDLDGHPVFDSFDCGSK